jgi:MFS family permease
VRVVLGSSAVVVLVACALFATARGHLIELTAAMGILGFGVGAFSAAMPAVILTTPIGETSSAMAFNQVVRSAGFSLGSAVGGLVLAAYTRQPVVPGRQRLHHRSLARRRRDGDNDDRCHSVQDRRPMTGQLVIGRRRGWRQPSEASASFQVFDGRITAAALAGSGW